MHSMMVKKGYFDEDQSPDKRKGKLSKADKKQKGDNDSNQGEQMRVVTDVSETTIYHNLLDKEGNVNADAGCLDPDDPEIIFKHRDSSSSEDQVDTSNELVDPEIIDQFIADCSRSRMMLEWIAIRICGPTVSRSR